ncbi:uncharacterized protein LOC124143061 [Haliotis rufescens]|uniref:uncharacterized protein LOC124143061 n=1 Tax=Haliotis rufescens TaxID=6454 RepID=UPI00201F07D9|nr:uncharacterized protein LOC124143061 [Haliotis rufescens]
MALSMCRVFQLQVVLCLKFIIHGSCENQELCTETFRQDKADLDPYRFQGYWFATHFFWSGLRWVHVFDVQSMYIYTPGTPSTWTVAVGVHRNEDQCIRRLFNISVPSTGSNVFRDAGYYHHVIDTDYMNYAVVLFCYNVRKGGRCDFSNIQTVILSRTPDGLEEQDVWTAVKEKVRLCTDPTRLKVIKQRKRCVCSLEDFEDGTGPVCE